MCQMGAGIFAHSGLAYFRTRLRSNQLRPCSVTTSTFQKREGPSYFLPSSLPKGDIALNLSTASEMHSAT